MHRTMDGVARARRQAACARYDALAASGLGLVPDQRPWADGRSRALTHVVDGETEQHRAQVRRSRAGEARIKQATARRRFAIKADRWLQRHRRMLDAARMAQDRVEPKPNLVRRAFTAARNLFRRAIALGGRS